MAKLTSEEISKIIGASLDASDAGDENEEFCQDASTCTTPGYGCQGGVWC